MNISVENIDKVNAVITAVVEPADYTEKYEKALKDAKKKMNMPGFRPGMVPVGLIKKQFGVSLLAEEVNKILQEGLFGYIRENKINMLGEPLPTEENNNVELKEGESFTFKFDLAIAPEFEVSLTKKDKIDYYNVDVTDQMVANQVDMYRQRGGKYEKVDSYEDNDMIKGVITELDVENPVTAENVVMLPKYFKNDDQKKLFDGVKTNDIVTFNPSVAYNNNEAELTSLLKVEKEDALNHKGEFNFQITEITRFVPGPLDQELFDTVFPGGEVKTEADFRAKVKELIADQFKKDSDYKAQIADRDFDEIVKDAIAEAKGRNVKAIKALLDVDTLKASKNQKADVEKAIKALTEAEDSKMLFGEDQPAPVGKVGTIGKVTGGTSGNDFLASIRAAAGLSTTPNEGDQNNGK